MLTDLDQSMIRHLSRTGWTVTQIADFVGQDRTTITGVLRELVEASPHVPGVAADPSAPPAVRLSRDARRLEIRLPAGALLRPTEVLLAQIQEECARQGIMAALTYEELEQRLQTFVYGTWLTVLQASRPTPPAPGRVQLLVPPPVGRRTGQPAPVVRRGTVLARQEAGRPGQPGRDLLGREIAPRVPREAPLPQGENTGVSPDGTELIALCDGQVVLRHLRLHVIPATIHEGDLTGEHGVLRSDAGVIVTGSVRDGGAIEAQGDVEIRGGVRAARIVSASGSITVAGAVVGTAHQAGMLRAGGAITCERVHHVALHAAGDLVVHADVRQSQLEVAGNVYLTQPLARSVFDTRLSVGGGVVVPVEPARPATDTPTERRHTRAPLTLPAHIACHGAPPFAFAPCVIEDLSPGGARCRLRTAEVMAFLTPETLLQLKCVLPGTTDQVIVVARAVRVIAPDGLGLAFVQITERDADRVMRFCFNVLREQKDLKLGTRADRRSDR